MLGLIFYASMAGAADVIDLVFDVAGLIPTDSNVQIMTEGVSWNYKTWLNIAGLLISALLLW